MIISVFLDFIPYRPQSSRISSSSSCERLNISESWPVSLVIFSSNVRRRPPDLQCQHIACANMKSACDFFSRHSSAIALTSSSPIVEGLKGFGNLGDISSVISRRCADHRPHLAGITKSNPLLLVAVDEPERNRTCGKKVVGMATMPTRSSQQFSGEFQPRRHSEMSELLASTMPIFPSGARW